MNITNVQLWYIGLVALTLGATACEQRPPQREYQEIVIASPFEQIQEEAQSKGVTVSWQTPEGWSEEKGSGMRLVTFTSKGKNPITCTIVSLGGMAGGLEANVVRWIGQLNLPPLPSKDLQKFLQQQKALIIQGDLTARVIDLTQLQKKKSDEAPSMIAAILDAEEGVVFIKMTGTKQAVIKNKKKFHELCRSLKI